MFKNVSADELFQHVMLLRIKTYLNACVVSTCALVAALGAVAHTVVLTFQRLEPAVSPLCALR